MSGAMDVVLRLANAQGKIYLDKGKTPWSADKPKNFAGISMFLVGRDAEKYLTAGDTITTLFDYRNQAHGGPKRPGAPHRSSPSEGLVTMESRLTEYEFGKEMYWHELALNGGDPLTPEGSQKIWSIAEKKNKEFIVGMMKKWEEDIFATPTASMFTGDGQGLYDLKSFWTGCNVWETRHGVPGEGLFPGMTDQQGLDPEDPRFARTDGWGGSQLAATKIGYGQSGNNNTTADDHILDRMDYLINLLGWEGTPMAGEFADAMDIRPKMAVCSRDARALFLRTNRAHGELFAVINPIGDPSQSTATFGGVPLMVSDSVGNAAIYPDVQRATSLNEAGAVNRDPVTEYDPEGTPGGYYYFIDPDASNIYMHKQRAMEIGDWKNLDQINEDLFRKLAKSVLQMHHERFVTHGILYPNTAVSGYSKAS